MTSICSEFRHRFRILLYKKWQLKNISSSFTFNDVHQLNSNKKYFPNFTRFDSRVAIRKRCLNSGQIDVINMEFFGSNLRRFSRGTQESPDVRRLYSQAIMVDEHEQRYNCAQSIASENRHLTSRGPSLLKCKHKGDEGGKEIMCLLRKQEPKKPAI